MTRVSATWPDPRFSLVLRWCYASSQRPSTILLIRTSAAAFSAQKAPTQKPSVDHRERQASCIFWRWHGALPDSSPLWPASLCGSEGALSREGRKLKDIVDDIGGVALVAPDGPMASLSPVEPERLELAQLILDGYDEVALYNAFGPGWHYFVQCTYYCEDQ